MFVDYKSFSSSDILEPSRHQIAGYFETQFVIGIPTLLSASPELENVIKHCVKTQGAFLTVWKLYILLILPYN